MISSLLFIPSKLAFLSASRLIFYFCLRWISILLRIVSFCNLKSHNWFLFFFLFSCYLKLYYIIVKTQSCLYFCYYVIHAKICETLFFQSFSFGKSFNFIFLQLLLLIFLLPSAFLPARALFFIYFSFSPFNLFIHPSLCWIKLLIISIHYKLNKWTSLIHVSNDKKRFTVLFNSNCAVVVLLVA